MPHIFSTSQSYTAEFKAQVIHEVQETQNATIVARRHQLSPSMVRRWSREVRQDTGKSSEGLSLAEENAQLKRLVIDRDLQIAVLQDALRKKGIHP
ncbi:MAG: transposase [Firmicutes bacterium]|nr:transposase [Bacillota bacterium]